MNRYDDHVSRFAFHRFCEKAGWMTQSGSKYAPVDAFVCTDRGKHLAIELACNSCWTTQAEYPQDIHIPVRKFKYFRDILTPPNGVTLTACSEGYFVLFNVEHTKAAVIKFSTLIDELFETRKLFLHDEVVDVALVPTTYIQKYIDIPR